MSLTVAAIGYLAHKHRKTMKTNYDAGLDVLGAMIGHRGPRGGGARHHRPARPIAPRAWAPAYYPAPYPVYDYYDDDDYALRVLAAKALLDEDDDTAQRLVETAELLGDAYEDVFGAFDIQSARAKMNSLKAVNVEIARILLGSGQNAILQANTLAKQPWYKLNLPGQSARDKVAGKLRWHTDELAKYTDPTALYPGGYDLKEWAMRAYIEANAAEEGSARLEQAWNLMWIEINTALAKIPVAARQALSNASSYVVEAVTGVPIWAWAVGGTVVAGLLGFTVYKIATGPLGQKAVEVAAKRYLP